MSIFFVDAGNDFSDQSFLLEAEDFVSATMKALDFLKELDRKIAERDKDEDLPPTRIKTINDTGTLWMNEEGMEECLKNVVVHVEEEDE